MLEKVNHRLLLASGGGNSRRTASVIIPRVPHEPMNILLRSSPATFFIVFPPGWMMSPVGVTTVSPKTRSRAVPYSNRNGPLALAASSPPIVDVSIKSGSRGKKNLCSASCR